MDIKAVGIDLVEFPPYTIKGDFHNLDFHDESFDIIFTNIIDHSLYPKRFCSEMERICIKEGILIIHLQIGDNVEKYDENYMYKPEVVLQYFQNVQLIESKSINNSHDSMHWEIILKKI